MNYLKIYEDYNRSHYYENIGRFDDIIGSPYDSFNEYELDKLVEISDKVEVVYLNSEIDSAYKNGYISDITKIPTVEAKALITIYKYSHDDISIIKHIDEWFVVIINRFEEKMYKCDQINGVIQLLKDKVINR